MNVMQGPGGDSGDLTDATRQWLRDEAAKTQAWIDANRPGDEHSTSLLYAQEAMRRRPPVGDYEARRDALRGETHSTRPTPQPGDDDIDRAEQAFWDGIDYSKLGEIEATDDGAGSMSEPNEPHSVDPLAEHDRPWHTHNVFDNRDGDAHGLHVPYSAEADPAVPDWAVQHDHSEFDEPPWDTATDGS